LLIECTFSSTIATKLPGLPHCFGTGSTMRQLPRGFEGLIGLRIQIQNDSLFGLRIYFGDVSDGLSAHLALVPFHRDYDGLF
jgi:hypothetical protein